MVMVVKLTIEIRMSYVVSNISLAVKAIGPRIFEQGETLLMIFRSSGRVAFRVYLYLYAKGVIRTGEFYHLYNRGLTAEGLFV